MEIKRMLYRSRVYAQFKMVQVMRVFGFEHVTDTDRDPWPGFKDRVLVGANYRILLKLEIFWRWDVFWAGVAEWAGNSEYSGHS